MRKNITWNNIRIRQDLTGGTLEMYQDTAKGVSYLRAMISSIRWENELPIFYLDSYLRFEVNSDEWEPDDDRGHLFMQNKELGTNGPYLDKCGTFSFSYFEPSKGSLNAVIFSRHMELPKFPRMLAPIEKFVRVIG